MSAPLSPQLQPELRQASCVLLDGRALLIEGEPGSGKSSLALALIDRGAILVGDDGVKLEQREGKRGKHIWASPPPNITGLLEIRNVGLVQMAVGEGPLCMIIRLDRQAPRFIDAADRVAIIGMQVPAIALFPDTDTLALRAEWAFRQYALNDPVAS